MATEIDYAVVLADLEAKRGAIDSAIAGVRQVLNLGAEQGVAPSSPLGIERKDQPTQVRFDTFFRMSMPSAIVKYLEMAKAPQSVSDVTKALLEGGFKTTSKNLMPIVGSNLSRLKSAGQTVNVEGKWGLASWYPAARKAELAPKSKRGRKRGRPKGSGKANAKGSTPTAEKKATPVKPTVDQIEQIKKLSAAGKKPGEVAKAVGLHHFTVMAVLKSKKAA